MKRVVKICFGGFIGIVIICCIVGISFVWYYTSIHFNKSKEDCWPSLRIIDDNSKNSFHPRCCTSGARASIEKTYAAEEVIYVIIVSFLSMLAVVWFVFMIGGPLKRFLTRMIVLADYQTPTKSSINQVPTQTSERRMVRGGLTTLILIAVFIFAIPYIFVNNYWLSYQLDKATKEMDPNRFAVYPALNVTVGVGIPDDNNMTQSELGPFILNNSLQKVSSSSRLTISNIRYFPKNFNAPNSLAFDVCLAGAEVGQKALSPHYIAVNVNPNSVGDHVSVGFNSPLIIHPTSAESRTDCKQRRDVLDTVGYTHSAIPLIIFSQQSFCDGSVPLFPFNHITNTQNGSSFFVKVTVSFKLTAMCRASFFTLTEELLAYSISDIDVNNFIVPQSPLSPFNSVAIEFEVPSVNNELLCYIPSASITSLSISIFTMIGALLGTRLALRGFTLKITEKIKAWLQKKPRNSFNVAEDTALLSEQSK